MRLRWRHACQIIWQMPRRKMACMHALLTVNLHKAATAALEAEYEQLASSTMRLRVTCPLLIVVWWTFTLAWVGGSALSGASTDGATSGYDVGPSSSHSSSNHRLLQTGADEYSAPCFWQRQLPLIVWQNCFCKPVHSLRRLAFFHPGYWADDEAGERFHHCSAHMGLCPHTLNSPCRRSKKDICIMHPSRRKLRFCT